jgi:hypothetical protein
MEADGTLSFQSWELHRDGRVRVRLPVAITDPFATITFTIVTIAPDAEEKILGVANTSILRLIEQQSTALLERENQEDRLIQKGALVAATAADEVGSSSSPPSSTATKVPQQHSGIRPSGTSILGISESLKESFQKQVMLAQGRGVASLRSATVLLRGPSLRNTSGSIGSIDSSYSCH